MQVKRNFDQVYAAENDPWNIGSADSERYNYYFDLIKNYGGSDKKILDIGSGFGSFLARFKDIFGKLVAVDVSSKAVETGKDRYPFIEFHTGTAEELDGITFSDSLFDVILLSDVVYYLPDNARHKLLEWASNHLNETGVVFIGAWCPKGRDYLEYDELNQLVRNHLSVSYSELLPSEHAIFIAEKKKRYAAITVDYETWQPIPEGKKIDWEKDVFEPANNLVEMAKSLDIPITFFVEIAEYISLKKFLPEVAEKFAKSIQNIARNGHDIQLHIHPSWLPELGADFKNGEWQWDMSKAFLNDYEGDLTALIRQCKTELELIVQPINPEYRVTCFRAGAYSVQPFNKLANALKENDILCDSSVFSGGVSNERGYNFSFAYSDHQPYWANQFDPQLKAPPAEQSIIELPIFTYEYGKRWFFDGDEGKLLSERLLNYLSKPISSSEKIRAEKKKRNFINNVYSYAKPIRKYINKFIPYKTSLFMTNNRPEQNIDDEFFVLIGHTKGEHEYQEILNQIKIIKEKTDIKFVSLSEMWKISGRKLKQNSRPSYHEETRYQVEREYSAIMGEERNAEQSYFLQSMIPFDRNKVLDLGCGSGYWSQRISTLYPWMKVVGVDGGSDFINKAREKYGKNNKLSFEIADFSELPFSKNSFDCVYADNTLEHAFDVQNLLTQVYNILTDDGVLVAALPSDARNPKYNCDNHTWKTYSNEVKMRLAEVGFIDISIKEVDTFKKLGMAPYSPSSNKMLYIVAWKRTKPITKIERVKQVTNWVYKNISPEKASETSSFKDILSNGYAYCIGYTLTLGEILKHENFKVRWVTMKAHGHACGRGEEQIDTHEVLEVEIEPGKWITCDPMANKIFSYPVIDIINQPELADSPSEIDERYKNRKYEYYATSYWYERVFEICTRKNPYYEKPFIKIKELPQKNSKLINLLRLSNATDSTYATVKEEIAKDNPGAEIKEFFANELREGGIKSALIKLWSMRGDRIVLVPENVTGQRRLIIFKVLALVARVKNREFRDGKGISNSISFGKVVLFDLPKLVIELIVTYIMALGWLILFPLFFLWLKPVKPKNIDKKDNLSIVFFRTDYYDGKPTGGSFSHIRGFTDGILELGHKIRFIASIVPTILNEEETPLELVDYPRFFDFFMEAAEMAFNIKLVTKALYSLKNNRPDFLYHRHSGFHIGTSILSRLTGIPLLLEVNNSEYWLRTKWDSVHFSFWLKMFEKIAWQCATNIFVVSDVLKDDLIRYGVPAEKIIVNPNGVDPKKFSPEVSGDRIREKLGYAKDDIIVGFLGTFGVWHGTPVLAEAIPEIVKENQRVKFLLIGEGAYRPEFEKIINKHGLENYVSLPGLVPHAEVAEWLAACDILASPHVPNQDGTKFFGSPTKLFEYMAMGKAIVASDLEQIGQILRNEETAILTTPGSASELATAVLKLADDENLRDKLGAGARADVIENYTWQKNADRAVQAYRRLSS